MGIKESKILVSDPLSEVTRKIRRFLLGTSAIGITIAKVGLVPTKISTLGVEFTQANQRSLLVVLSLVTSYFLVAFLIYAWSDFISWRLTYFEALEEEIALKKRSEIPNWWIQPFTMRFSTIIRLIFEFVFPVFLGIYTIISLILD